MQTGVAYLGHHNPRHVETDLEALHRLGCDDVLLAAQENDFVHLRGKLQCVSSIARDKGIRPIAIFWGALNLFGGGRNSQWLLEHPEGHQTARDGSWNAAGCYNNPLCVAHVESMIDQIARFGFEGYFVDEPAPLDCYCRACADLFAQWYDGPLAAAGADELASFRRRCVVHYVASISGYVKGNHPSLETLCCLTPQQRDCWSDVARIETLDCLGTDFYWANDSRDLAEMQPLIHQMATLCRAAGRRHHQWLQCWGVQRGGEPRIAEIGHLLVQQHPDALYVWAYEGQIGTTEACDDPQSAWAAACEVLRLAKSRG